MVTTTHLLPFFEHNLGTNQATELGLNSNWRSYHADYKSYVLFRALMSLSGDIGIYTLIYFTTKFKQQPFPQKFPL